MKKSKGTYTIEKMRPIVEGYANFQGTKKEYCAPHDLNPYTLDYWRSRIKEIDGSVKNKKIKEDTSSPIGFIAVPPPASSVPSASLYTLHLPDGKRLDLPLTTSIELLTQLLQIQTPI